MRAKLWRSEQSLCGRFEVRGERVRATRTKNGEDVWRDSTVEVFLQHGSTYVNLEMSARGVAFASHMDVASRQSLAIVCDFSGVSIMSTATEFGGEKEQDWELIFEVSWSWYERFFGQLHIAEVTLTI